MQGHWPYYIVWPGSSKFLINYGKTFKEVISSKMFLILKSWKFNWQTVNQLAVIRHSYTHIHTRMGTQACTHTHACATDREVLWYILTATILLSGKDIKSMLGQFAWSHLWCLSPEFSSSSNTYGNFSTAPSSSNLPATFTQFQSHRISPNFFTHSHTATSYNYISLTLHIQFSLQLVHCQMQIWI
jgi:hypothetical protein